MKSKFNVSEAEREVLEKIWLFPEGIRQPELLRVLEADGRQWKRQTVNTFIARMEDKGVVTREGKLVKAVYTRDEFDSSFIQDNIEELYGGKIRNLISALVKNNKIAEKDINELKEFINTYEKGEL